MKYFSFNSNTKKWQPTDLSQTLYYTQAQSDARYSSSAVQTGNRNAIINGGFDIWQRGTGSFLGTGYNYCADRWMEFRGGFASGMTVTRQPTGLSGFQYGIRLQRDFGNAGTTTLVLQHTLETENSIPFQGKNITVSFYARVGVNFSASGIFLNVNTGEGVNQAASNQNYAWTNPETSTKNFTGLDTTWKRYTFTTTLNSKMTQLGIQLTVNPVGTANTDDWVEFTGVQLEQGSIASPFEHRDIGTELALCQRYYQNIVVPTGTTDFNWPIVRESTTQAQATIFLPVTLRASPTLVGANLGRIVCRDTSFTVVVAAVSSISLNTSGGPSLNAVTFILGHGAIAGTFVYAEWDTLNTTTNYALSAEL
jgi:hypothetical protein